jgi:hypothetical protein
MLGPVLLHTHEMIGKWMLYWSRGQQTVAELSDCNNFQSNIFTPVNTESHCIWDYMQISIQAVAILLPISGNVQITDCSVTNQNAPGCILSRKCTREEHIIKMFLFAFFLFN